MNVYPHCAPPRVQGELAEDLAYLQAQKITTEVGRGSDVHDTLNVLLMYAKSGYDFVSPRAIIPQVNMARVYNYDIKLRRLAKARDGTPPAALPGGATASAT